MSKILSFDKEAKEKLLSGIRTLARAVKATHGPTGSNVALGFKWEVPSIIHDGVGVAKEISLEDPFENMGAQLVKEAASKTNDNAGDGTTTSIILAEALIEEGFKKIENGENPMKLRRSILAELNMVISQIKAQSRSVKNKKEIKQVAKISSQDEEIGEIVSEVVNKMGEDGVISIEDGNGTEITVDYREGMEIDRGYASSYFVTNPQKMEAEVKESYILLTDMAIYSSEELKSFLQKVLRVSKNLVIIADEIEGEALTTLVVNKLRGTMNILAVKTPSFGEGRKNALEDIAALTGGKVISRSDGKTLESVEIEDLGRADSVWSDRDTTKIVGGKGSKDQLNNHISLLKEQLNKSTLEFDREKLQERIAKLVSGVAVIKIGARTEVEMKEKKERVIDAVAATSAALEEGVVAGGATVFLRAAKLIDDKSILSKALKEPFAILMENAGLQYLEEYNKVIEGEKDFGVDVMDSKYKNMIEAGIIEPTKVVRCALENAVSVAMTILTTKVLITDKPEKEDK